MRIIENLTQRTNEYMEEEQNVLAIKNHLVKDKILLDDKGTAVHPSDNRLLKDGRKAGEQHNPELGSIRQICLWLDKDLRKDVEKKHVKSKLEREENNLNYTQAVLLSGLRLESDRTSSKHSPLMSRDKNEVTSTDVKWF